MIAQYMPVLKGKQGELRAVAEMVDSDLILPIIEIVPWEREANSPSDERAELQKSADRVLKAWGPKAGLVFVDVAMAEYEPESWNPPTSRPLLSSLFDLFRTAPVAPVIRASSVAVDGYLAAVRAAATSQNVSWDRAIIRFTAEDLDETVAPLKDVASIVADTLNLNRARVDVLMDFGAMSNEDALSMASRLARFVLPQFEGQGWRSLNLGAGSFPVDLSEVTAGAVAKIPRLETSLWQRASSFLSSDIGFSDYAVTHPTLPQGAPFAAPPQLRFAEQDHWLVAKGRRNDRRGHAQFFDICARIRDSVPELSFTDSWGDRQILTAADAALQTNPSMGPGNASTWRAIATSRHLSLVERRLSEAGVP